MKFKVTITEGAPDRLFRTFGEGERGRRFEPPVVKRFYKILSDTFGIRNLPNRPAPYIVQAPDRIAPFKWGVWGIFVTVAGISRGQRESPKFLRFQKAIEGMVVDLIHENMAVGDRINLFDVIYIDKDVEQAPGDYTNLMEGPEVWIEGALDRILAEVEWPDPEPDPELLPAEAA